MYSLLFIISATCFSACCSHSDDTPEPTPQPSPGPTVETGTPISFYGQESEEQDVSQGVKGTRADMATRAGMPLSEAGVTSFNVWGYKNMDFDAGVYGGRQEVFPGYTVNWSANSSATTTTNSSGWEYILLSKPEQTIKYWDWKARAYRYFAVTGGVSATPETYGADGTYWTSGTYGTYKFTISADASPEYDAEATAAKMNATPYFSRLWFSTGELPAYIDKQFGQPVKLEFVKPYARVRFIFKYAYPREGIKLTEKCFKPTTDFDNDPSTPVVGIARKGTVTVHYPTEGPEIKEWYSMAVDADNSTRLEAFTEDFDPEDDGKVYTVTDNGWYMVVPNDTQGSYTLSVEVNKLPKTCTVSAEYMRWLPGYSYTYIFKILEEGGVVIELVQAAFTPWVDMAIDRTVYNW